MQRDEKAPTGEHDKPQPAAGGATRQLTIPGAKGFGPSAVVLITPAAAAALTGPNPEVHVLVHFHGITGGYGDAGQQRAGWDQIAPQIEGSGRKMIAVLPQAGRRVADKAWSFGRAVANPTEYVSDAMAKLKDQEKWAAAPKFSVALSGHSGGGFQAAKALSSGLKPEEVLLFDGINGYLELGSMIDWVTAQLNGALSALKAAAGDPQKEEEALGQVVFFRAYHHGADLDPAKDHVDLSRPFAKNRDAIGDRGYAGRHAILQDAIDQWFKASGSQLNEPLRGRLRHNFQVVGIPGTEHEPIVGKSHGIEQGLKRTPDVPPMGPIGRADAAEVADAPSQVQRQPGGTAGPDFEAEFNSLSFKGSIEGGLEGFKKIRDRLIATFGSLAKANIYYRGVGSGAFLGRTPQVHKASLGAKLTAAEKLLTDKGWYDAVVAASPKAGGFNIRPNRNNADKLSDHSFGWAIDIDADLNPNVKSFPAAVVKGISGEGMFGGEANTKMAAGGTAAELQPWAEKMVQASKKFQGAFTDEAALKTEMVGYLSSKLGMTISADQFDLALVKAAKEKGNKEQKKKFQALVALLAGAKPNLALAIAEQTSEKMEAIVEQNGWDGWKKYKEDREKAEKKKGEALLKEWGKDGDPLPSIDQVIKLLADSMTEQTHGIATNASRFLVDMWAIYVKSFKNMKKGTRVKESSVGSAGSVAAHGFLNLRSQLIAALAGSDGGNLDWLGAAAGTKDFMHFQLKPEDRPSL